MATATKAPDWSALAARVPSCCGLIGGLEWLATRGVVEFTRRDNGEWAADVTTLPHYSLRGHTGATLDEAVRGTIASVLDG